MSAHPRRILLASALGLVACLAVARPAAAQSTLTGTAGTLGTTTTTTSLADGDIFIGVQQTEGANLSAFDLARFFNKANCDCSTQVFLYYTLTNTGFAKRASVPTGTVSFWIGTGCDNILTQATNCQFLGSDQIATFMNLGRETIPTTARAMSANTTLATEVVDGGIVTSGTTGANVPNADCTSPTNGFNQTVWAVFDYGSDGTFDYSATQAVFVDLTPPPAPTGITVKPGNEAVTVSWTGVDYTLNMDLQGYQIFCQRADGLQVFANNTFGAVAQVCSQTAGTGVLGLDPLFACSPLLNRTADSYRVKILQNGIEYAATVVAIDVSGNASTPTLNGCQTVNPNDPNCSWQVPVKTDSFFDVYRDGNQTNGGAGQVAMPGKATGGFCAVAGDGRWTAGLGVGAAAFAMLATGLARARRRRR